MPPLCIDMKNFKNTLLLFLPAIIWGFSFVAQTKAVDSDMGTLTFNMVKYIIGTLSLVPVILIFDKKDTREFDKKKLKPLCLYGFLAGVVLYSASFFQQYAIELGVKSQVSNITGLAGFMTGTYIIMIPVIRLIGGKKTGITTAIGAVLAVIGLYLLCVTNGIGSITKSHIFLLICAFLFAMQIIIIDKFAGDFSSLKFSLVQFLTVAVLSTISAFIFEEPRIERITAGAVPLFYSGILSVGVAYTCQTIAQKKADPTFAGIVFSTESVFSAIGGALLLHEIMTARAYFGCAIIFAGIVISQIEIKKKAKTIEN